MEVNRGFGLAGVWGWRCGISRCLEAVRDWFAGAWDTKAG